MAATREADRSRLLCLRQQAHRAAKAERDAAVMPDECHDCSGLLAPACIAKTLTLACRQHLDSRLSRMSSAVSELQHP